MPRPYLIAVGLVLVAAATIALAGIVLRPLWQARAARGWTITTCRISSLEIIESEDTHGRQARDARLRYVYTVGDRDYEGHRYDFVPFRDGRAEARDVRRLFVGAPLLCRYDPDDPTSAVLVPRGWIGFPGPLVLACAIVGIAIVTIGVGKPGSERRTVRRDGGISFHVRGQSRVLAGALALVTAVTIPTVLLALTEDRGLIAIGFALLGFLVVVKLVQVLGLVLTGVDVDLAPAALRPGAKATLRWKVRTSAPPRSTTARLVSYEETEYQVDDSRDHRTKLVVDQLVEAAVAIPEQAMPSLTTGPCRRRWAIAVHASIRGWPDVAVELALEVEPAPAGEPLRGVVPIERIPDGAQEVELQLRWRSISEHGERETVVARHKVDLPRDEGGSPYRAAGPPTYSFSDPVHPPAYRGELFRIDWRIVLVVDGRDVHAIDAPVRMAR
jgi:hypothetical protein